MNKLTKKDINSMMNILDDMYGTDIKCYLNYSEPYELLIATILSAQCTDERVNKITEELFRKYDTIEAFANADIKELEQDIKSAGFYHNKAKSIIAATKELIEKFDGKMPSDIDVLTKLVGVGRKTANVIRGNIFGIQSVVVDTHVKRISKLLGLTDNDDPVKIEYDLMKKIPENHWILINKQLIAHGRSICVARKPACNNCRLSKLCRYGKNV